MQHQHRSIYHRCPLNGLGVPQSWSGRFEKPRNLLCLSRIEITSFGRCSHSVVSVLITIPRLLHIAGVTVKQLCFGTILVHNARLLTLRLWMLVH